MRFAWTGFIIAIMAAAIFVGTGERPSYAQATSRGGELQVEEPSFDGVWQLADGVMELGQTGRMVFGTYTPSDGRIAGKIKDRTLTFTWSVDEDNSVGMITTGTGEITISDDETWFTGSWKRDGEEESSQWSGTRIGDRVISGTPPEIDYCFWRGAWEIGDGPIVFSQDIDSSVVTGEFIRDGVHGTLEGEADGWALSFEWKSGEESGQGWFVMSHDMGAFTGLLEGWIDSGEAELKGEFVSGRLREDFAGVWQTEWGDMTISQDTRTGIVGAEMESAKIAGRTGQCKITGTVLGGSLSFDWTLITSAGTLNGQGTVEMGLGEQLFAGRWWFEGKSERSWKLTGSRE